MYGKLEKLTECLLASLHQSNFVENSILEKVFFRQMLALLPTRQDGVEIRDCSRLHSCSFN